jgi:hypothetical protein
VEPLTGGALAYLAQKYQNSLKRLPGKNTLAYFVAKSVTKKKVL